MKHIYVGLFLAGMFAANMVCLWADTDNGHRRFAMWRRAVRVRWTKWLVSGRNWGKDTWYEISDW